MMTEGKSGEGKFAALRLLRQPANTSEADQPTPATAIVNPKGKGRPPGKRSNPEWKLYSHFLKKQTQREATAILRAEDDARDLSDVLQELLEKWIAQAHRRKSD
jgi:hypothetical protein